MAEMLLSESNTSKIADAVFPSLKEYRYPRGFSDVLKRTYRRKVTMCIIRDSVLYVQMKKND